MQLSPILLLLVAAVAVIATPVCHHLKRSNLVKLTEIAFYQVPIGELTERTPEAPADLEDVRLNPIPHVVPLCLCGSLD